MVGSPAALDNPIVNSPDAAPERHFVLGRGSPTGDVRLGRRPSESFVPFAFDPQVLNVSEDFVASAESFDVAAERALGRIPVLLASA
ncbi:MAG: hypothetical protein ACRDZ2_03625 [Ilumatobacteraceae bacterium]